MATFNDINTFFKRYYRYYLALESDFLATERFVTIDQDNSSAFSVEYIKLLQTICSEIEVVAKYLCTMIDAKAKCKDFTDCCKIITTSNTLFERATTTVPQLEGLIIAPFLNWTFSIEKSKEGKEYTKSNNPEWWQKYNKVKHDRTGLDTSTGVYNYKHANQGNVLNALAALYILNSYIIFELCKNLEDKKTQDYFLGEWKQGSRIFNSFLVAANK
jgi:hypothetical protein